MYYPNVDEENSDMVIEFGKFRLNYLSEKPNVDYSIRTIECENLQVGFLYRFSRFPFIFV
jgi:hypothetical protein